MSFTVYRASAGSGKTYALTHAYVSALLNKDNPTSYLNLLAITFTRKATKEMKSKILKLLEEESPSLHSAILHNYGQFSVMTIDSFFQKIIGSFLWEAGIPPSYSVELDTQRLLQEAIDQVVDEVSTHQQNRRWIGNILSDRIREGKRWNFQEAFSEVGKQVVNERFSLLGNDFITQLNNKEFLHSFMQELSALDLDFQSRMKVYAQEVFSFLESQGLSCSDFKGKSRSFMFYFQKVIEDEFTPPPTLRKALDDSSLWFSKGDPNAHRIEGIINPLSHLVKKCLDYYDKYAPQWFTVKLIINSLPQMGLAADVLRHLRTLLSNNNAVHLSQTLQLLATLATYNDVPFILERMGCRYSSFFFDEFQDTSALQWEVLLPLVHNGLSQDKPSMAVGDVKQSIYRWRNSDRRILGKGLNKDLHPNKPVDESLRTNWRSNEVLVDTVGTIFEQLINTVVQDFNSELPIADPSQEIDVYSSISQEITNTFADVRQQIAPAQKGRGGYVTVQSFLRINDQTAEDQLLEQLPFLIMEIQDRGFSASEIAILVRKNEEGQKVAAALMSYKDCPEGAKYCFDVVSPDSLFLCNSPEVQLIMAFFKQFVYPNDELNNCLIRHLCTQLGVETPDSFLLGKVLRLTLLEAFDELIRILQWTHRVSAFPYFQELHNQILSFTRPHNLRFGGQATDIFSFVRWWNQNGEKITLIQERSGSAIEILTIHKSKGLEYPVVILPFCNWELDYLSSQAPLLWVNSDSINLSLPYLPQVYGSKMAQGLFAQDYYIEKMQRRIDQLNLFYVAATRAQNELHLMLPLPERTSYNLATILTKQLFEQNQLSTIEGATLTFGAPSKRDPLNTLFEKETIPLQEYASDKTLLHLHAISTFEQMEFEHITPQKRGIILHRILSMINSKGDLDFAISQLADEGMISPDLDEQKKYSRIIKNALEQPLASGWFDGTWHTRNEASILLPSLGYQTIRPDRVMEKDGRTLIIDYKFGHPLPAHQHQMNSYVETLHRMGVRDVEGYVWYIHLT